MKRIPMREVPGDAPIEVLRYAEVLREVIRRPLNPQQGATIEEIRQSVRVLDALDAANGTLELEDADYEHLKQKTLAMPWNVIDRRLVQLVDEVLSAQ
jgi:hypothetical protein